MRSRFLFALFACLLATALFTVGCGGGGGDDSILNPTSAANPEANEGGISGNGVATGYASSNAVPTSIRTSLRAGVTAPAANARVVAGDYDETGQFVSFNKETTTDPNGFYLLGGLPTGRKNIVLRIYRTGIDDFMEGILPLIEDGMIATAPLIDPNTKYQAMLVKYAEAFDATFEVNLGEILSIIPPSKLPQAPADLMKIAQAFVNREKAQLQTFRAAGFEDAKFIEFRKIAFDLQNKINAGIAEGLYTSDEGWQLFNDQLRLLARTLGLPADVLLALQDIDSTMINNALPSDTTITQQFQYQHILAKLEGLLVALKVLIQSPANLPEADYNLIAAGIERVSTALKTAPDAEAIDLVLQSDSLHGLFQAAFKTIFTNLGLFEGKPPLLSKLYPTPAEVEAIKAAAGGYIPDLGSMTVSVSIRGQTITSPTPIQISAFHDAIRDLMLGKIRALIPALTQEQDAALFLLLMQGPEMGFSYIPADIPSDGNFDQLPGEIMGVIVECNEQLYIQPPDGYPEGPVAFSGFIAMVDPESRINGNLVTATTTAHIYSGFYTAKPAENTPPTFKITGIINGTVTIPELGKMTFTGGPLEQDTNGKFWFGLGKPVATEFVPTSDMIANTMQGFLGRMVQIEGMITAKRPAPDYGPAVVDVYAIMPASMTGYIPPDVELPTVPVYGTMLEKQSGLWSFDKAADQPQNMFKFTWTVNNVATSAYVDFNPDGLDKIPLFRHQNPVSGRDLWESNDHTVTISGKAFTASNGTHRIFMTAFVDESTVWPDPEIPFTPPSPPTGGTPVTNLPGTFVFTPENASQPFEFTWMADGTHIAFVEFDMATLQKSPAFRYQDPINGHDMWESHLHNVTVDGMLSADGTHLFITRFVDASTEWPPRETMPTNTGMKLRGVLLPVPESPSRFCVTHFEISTGTAWVFFDLPLDVMPNVLIDPATPETQNLILDISSSGNYPVGIELSGTWGASTPDLAVPTKKVLHFVPTTAKGITTTPPDGTHGWLFGN
ncbi:hypothetical protein KBA41_08750 [Candidatus Ozemobacteraceae bacterium]|nr:hypothetical protein [Candidatus Ozemobacteraceae bacterium]